MTPLQRKLREIHIRDKTTIVVNTLSHLLNVEAERIVVLDVNSENDLRNQWIDMQNHMQRSHQYVSRSFYPSDSASLLKILFQVLSWTTEHLNVYLYLNYSDLFVAVPAKEFFLNVFSLMYKNIDDVYFVVDDFTLGAWIGLEGEDDERDKEQDFSFEAWGTAFAEVKG